MEKQEKNEKKAFYLPPSLSIIKMEMEESIAASSAAVTAPKITEELDHEWEKGIDREQDIPW